MRKRLGWEGHGRSGPRRGGFGVLGAVAHTPDQLEIDLTWIEEQTHGRPYGLDLLLPTKYAGADEGGIDRDTVRQLLPPEQEEFVDERSEERRGFNALITCGFAD